jgi:hypothetical protein
MGDNIPAFTPEFLVRAQYFYYCNFRADFVGHFGVRESEVYTSEFLV